MILGKQVAIALITLCVTTFSYATKPQKLTTAEEDFIKTTALQYHLSPKTLKNTLNKAHYVPSVIEKIKKPYETQPIDIYLAHFLTQNRIQNGALFWKNHAKTLALAEKTYGVDPSVIIAILGIETLYGKNTGHYSVLDALYTLSFYYPPRAKFFKNELAQFLVMCDSQHLSPFKIKGSYAGAIGMPQFMPSSYRMYGVDFSHNHQIDLTSNADDVIMSVANFLAKAKWQRSEPIESKITFKNAAALSGYISSVATPTSTVAELKKNGISPQIKVEPNQPASLIQLSAQDHEEYRMVFPNFKSIMRYNPNLTYAMAVYQLADRLHEQHAKQRSS